MKKNKLNKGVIFCITSLLLVTIILLGLTYAYYRTRIVGNTNEKSVSVDTKKYEVTYTDGLSNLSSEGKIEPGFTVEKEFTVTNTGNVTVNYSIILDNIENTYTRDQDWTYTLTKDGSEIANGTIAVGTHQVLIGSETLESGSQTYKLTVTYINSTEDQSVDMGENMSFRVNISDESQTWKNATNGTLLYAIKTNQPSGTGSTTPGQEASASTEARILEAQDDYGTSYVYRGNVTNNYVNYSGMCWRIVRVQGDGTIKLVLADENGECNASTYSTDNTTSAFIDGRTNIAYKSVQEFSVKHFLFENSNIKTILNNWVTSKNLDTSKLVDAEWCVDTSRTGVSGSAYYYGAYDRLWNPSTASPTLKCNMKGMEGTEGIEAVSQRYIGKIALLTADEEAFAGTIRGNSEVTYYLHTNADAGDFYWLLSPAEYGRYTSKMWTLLTYNGVYYPSGLNYHYGSVRPSIVLTSNVTIKGGDGTVDNPYIVE